MKRSDKIYSQNLNNSIEEDTIERVYSSSIDTISAKLHNYDNQNEEKFASIHSTSTELDLIKSNDENSKWKRFKKLFQKYFMEG